MTNFLSLIQFHSTLNPKFWSKNQMKLDVRVKLLRTAIAFYQFLDIPKLVVKDIVLTGSSAAFNYTKVSDLDVHLIVDFSTAPCSNLIENIFTTKKSLWSAEHDITIHGQPVELYVEDANSSAISNGVYSILHGQWIKKPKPIEPTKNDNAVLAKVNAIKIQIDGLLKNKPNEKEISSLMKRIHSLRQNGLRHGGEFSTENLTYKVLRGEGYLDKLYNAKKTAVDDDLSL